MPNPTSIARFVNVRSPQDVRDIDGSGINVIRPPKTYESALLKMAEDGVVKTREEIQKKAKQSLPQTADNLSNMDILDAVRRAIMPRGVTAGAASNTIKDILGKTPAQILALPVYKKRWFATWDHYYAQTLLGADRRETGNVLRAAFILGRFETMAAGEKMPTWSEALRWRISVPKGLFLPVRPKDRTLPPKVKDILGRVEKLAKEYAFYKKIADKARVEDKRFYRFGKGAESKNVYTFKDKQLGQAPTLDQMTDVVKRGKKAVLSDDSVMTKFEQFHATQGAATRSFMLATAESMSEAGSWLREELEKPPAKSVFEKAEQDFLKSKNVDSLDESERNAIDMLEKDFYRETRDLLYMPKYAMPAELAADKNVQYMMQAMKLPMYAAKAKGSAVLPVTTPAAQRVHVLGIGDLIVVEEQVNRYELGEVAHIENVMGKETRNRTHIRIAETETTLTQETEETTVDEKSLQTTDRFELSKETQDQLETSLEVTAGATVSASYGPVSISANAGLSSSTSASTSRSTSSTLAREAVEKAVSKVTRRVREEQVSRTLNRIEETNEHGFVNDTVNHISGIYRWVDKYYTVRAVNYGRRLMLEMIVPEPANGLIYAQDMHSEEEPIKPPPPPVAFGPEDLTRWNYLDYAETYSATDIPAPPPEVIYQTVTYGAVSDGKESVLVVDNKTLTIPEGYQTTNVWKNSAVSHLGDGDFSGESYHFAGSKWVTGSSSTLSGVTGTLEVASMAVGTAFVAGFKIRCELLQKAFENWQVTAWSSIKQAYVAEVSAYEEKVAARAIGQGVHIEGRNPEQNQEIIRNELKRAAIKYLSDDMGTLIVDGTVRTNEIFNAADDTGDFDIEEARIEGMIVQFFEQAFEWHNMTWLLYPYFWANQSRQHMKLLSEDPDPKMRDFLGAGAARVVVPVPEVYEDAVLNFFETNEIWNGGEPPMIDDPEFVSIAEELKQGRTDSFNSPIYYEGAGTPPPFIIDEWEVKLPTSLVKLQPDDILPKFQVGLFETDTARLLDQKVQSTGAGANWRNSIIDLLRLYGVANTDQENARRAFANTSGYPGDHETDAIASIDRWTYFFVLGQIDLHGLS